MEGLVRDEAADRAFFRDRNVLVTGATGLLGSWLSERLVSLGANVVGLVRDFVPTSRLFVAGSKGTTIAEGMTLVSGDIRDRELLERVMGEHEIDSVFHLAAQTIVGIANANPVSTFESNVAGAWNVFEAARRSPKVRRVLLASSDKAYGSHETLPYTEAMALRGEHPYDVSKSCADLIARTYWVTYRLPITITRCANLYGGGDLNWNRIVPGVIRDIVAGRRPVIRSDGTLIRDYLYVEDAVDAYLDLARAMEDPAVHGEAFNISAGNQLTVLEMTRAILERMGSTLEPDVRGQATHEIAHQYLDAEKARRVLGIKPRYGLVAGLDRTTAWYRDFLAREGRRAAG
ncbi:GDP-mannose 4,6-dehydratase [Polyangium sorediatum]|uniref:GDP-mannose 4,6-dehydratase n=1 Tax=Polyangium sorediatum TaxID=889274 RepID=A0ABT6P100_9BACT|nr:GDP-mannose 4,6-dehydratase [Polyangium sorediatum]MDI1434206.1 GDP-mannose 4,6-dehydratase [Polyangium sorediatum]